MHVHWKHTCFLCAHPIDIHICPETMYETYAYYHYRFIYNPIPLFMNRMYLKYIGKRMRRVCVDCFVHYRPVPFKVLRDRENGRRLNCARKSESIALDELRSWLEEMPSFFYPS